MAGLGVLHRVRLDKQKTGVVRVLVEQILRLGEG
jgi:hypothetical protein